MSTPPRDAGIPMLTEVIEDAEMAFVGPPAPGGTQAQPMPAQPETGNAPPVAGSPPLTPAYPLPLKPAAPPTASVSTPTPAPAAERPAPPAPAADSALPAPLSEEQWKRMERRVRERILGQLLMRTDAVLEERIRTSLAGVLEHAVEDLAATLRQSLHKTLDDVVSRAVAQEISRLQASKK